MSVDYITPALQLGSTGLKAVSGLQSASSENRTAVRNAENQAEALLRNAAIAGGENARQQDMLRRRQRAAIGKQVAGMAQNGSLGSGTGVNVLDQSLIAAETDALTLGWQGETERDSLRFDAQNILRQAQNASTAARKGGRLRAAGMLAESLADAYGPLSKSLSRAYRSLSRDPGTENSFKSAGALSSGLELSKAPAFVFDPEGYDIKTPLREVSLGGRSPYGGIRLKG